MDFPAPYVAPPMTYHVNTALNLNGLLGMLGVCDHPSMFDRTPEEKRLVWELDVKHQFLKMGYPDAHRDFVVNWMHPYGGALLNRSRIEEREDLMDRLAADALQAAAA